MKKTIFYFLILLICLCPFSCYNSSNEITSNNTPIEKNEKHTPSIVGKWFYNSEDDRYYCNFLSNGTVCYVYYQDVGPKTSALNDFVSKVGKWSYINEEKTKFSISWDDSVDCWYDIISEDDEKIVIAKDLSGPLGFGLFSITELLKNAKKVIFTVDNEISDLMGTWYFDETKNGKYLSFQKDGYCFYHYYQEFGGSYSHLSGYVTAKGIWHYSSDTKILAITMNGEVTYYYEIVNLTSNSVILKMPENNPAGKSIIYSDSQLYK